MMKLIIGALISILIVTGSIFMVTDANVCAQEVKTFTQRQYLILMDKALDAIIEKCRKQPQHRLTLCANISETLPNP
jgi:Leu/Phe-tRNA-protein transferase